MNRFKLAWYWPAKDDEAILRLSDRQPCKAAVVAEREGEVDLKVLDHFGNQFVRLHVPTSVYANCDRCVIA
jgi:hypothetical protein